MVSYQNHRAYLVGVRGFEPRASWSRTKRATNCATPRQPVYYTFFDPNVKMHFTVWVHICSAGTPTEKIRPSP